MIDDETNTGDTVTHDVTTELKIGPHQESLTLDITKLHSYAIMLGIPWLKRHDPWIQWSQHRVTFNSPFCLTHCKLRRHLHCVPDAIWKGVSEQVEKDLGIPARNVLLTATHTHSVPGQTGPDYIRKIVESVRMAKERLAPARIGYGTGVSYINVNRNIIDPKTRRWWEGPNYDGPSDKTVAVIKFETLTGEPIAVYYNYAMHAVTVGQLDLVSADAPGTTSKYIEDSFDNKIVALWSSGAAGDQNPIYFQQTFDLRDIRIKDYAKRGIDISNAMPPGGQGLNKKDPVVIKLMNQQKQMIVSMGQFLGEEVLHVMRGMERTDSDVEIYGGLKTVSCPGRTRTNEGAPASRGHIRMPIRSTSNWGCCASAISRLARSTRRSSIRSRRG